MTGQQLSGTEISPGESRRTGEEIKAFKKHIYVLAMTVIGVTASVFVLSDLLWRFRDYLPFYNMFDDKSYFFIWLTNDIIVYLPALVIFGLAFRKHMDLRSPGEAYKFKMIWIIPFFLAVQTSSVIMNYVSQFLAYLLRPVFGGGGLRDVFGNVMPQSGAQFIIMLAAVGVVGPILEELIYRHCLLRPLRRYGDLQAVIITSLLFGFFHGNLTQFLYTAAAGFFLGMAAVKANSVIPAIIIHIINNTYQVYYWGILLFAEDSKSSSSMTAAFSWALVAAGAVVLIIMAVKRRFKLENSNPYIPGKERARIIFQNPLVILMAAILIAVMIKGS